MKKEFKKPHDVRWVFFGTPDLSVTILDELARAGFLPSIIVTRPDAPVGRGNVLTPPPVKVWAHAHTVPVLQPQKMTPDFIADLQKETWDVFIVAAYGKILPQTLLDIPAHGTLNVHPSLLPRLRGPSPIVSAILTDESETGVSIIVLDAQMDHGPIVEQEVVEITDWPPRASDLERLLAKRGGELLADTLIPWVRGEIRARAQEDTHATFCKIIKKEDGLINLSDDPYQNLLKIRAFDGWPGTYTFFERGEKKIRVQIIDARLSPDGSLEIITVRPEGKRDMPYADFHRGFLK